MMELLSNKIKREDVKPGDHIYSWRVAYSYAHHGIYVGDGMVIHFTRGAGRETGTGTILDQFVGSSQPTMKIPCEKCGDHSMLHGVLISCIDCFLSGGDLHLFHYSASPALFIAQARGGTCTLAASDPPDDVLHRAYYLLENGFGTYCIFKNNCEDFALYCKTGMLVTTNSKYGGSGQLGSFLAAASAIASSPRGFLTSNLGGLTVVGGVMYCVNRYMHDVGRRQDVEKIPVERLVSQLNSDVPGNATVEFENS